MTNTSRASRWGWGILIVLSALMILQGVTWFYSGPESVASFLEEDGGVPIDQLTESYPVLAEHITRNTRQVAVRIATFGLLGMVVGLAGYRTNARWAWYGMWALPLTLAAVAFVYYSPGELGFFNIGQLGIAGLGVIGLLLARQGPEVEAAPEPNP